MTGKSEVIAFRVTAEEAAELREWSARTGRTVASIVREGIRYPLERERALWLEEHRSDPAVWEVTEAVQGPPRNLDSVFGVRVTGEQLRDLLPAAEAMDLPLSRFLRDAGLKLAAEMQRGRTFSCPHLSIGNVTSASCGQCGSLKAAA